MTIISMISLQPTKRFVPINNHNNHHDHSLHPRRSMIIIIIIIIIITIIAIIIAIIIIYNHYMCSKKTCCTLRSTASRLTKLTSVGQLESQARSLRGRNDMACGLLIYHMFLNLISHELDVRIESYAMMCIYTLIYIYVCMI